MPTAAVSKAFTVNLHGSHPDLDNDDCWTGADFDNFFDAACAAADWREHFNRSVAGYYGDAEVAFVEISGDGVRQLVENPKHSRAKRRADCEDRVSAKGEAAMQAGMAFGCAGYNDEMGW